MELDGRFNLAVDQGAAFDRKFVWRRGTGTPVDLTGRTAALEVVSRDGGAPLLSLTQGDGITLGGAAGTIVVHIDAADTAVLEPTGQHPLLFQLTVTGGSPFRTARIASGFLTVSAQGSRGKGIERIVDRKDAVIEVADTPDLFTGSFLDGYVPLWSEAQGAFVMTEPATGGDGGVALAAHVAATDPHTGYQKESEKGLANGYAALDGGGVVPDAQLPAALARDTEVTTAVAAEISARDAAIAAHAAAADPHTGYQRESEKGSANGYAALDGSGVVPDAQLPSAIARDAEVTSAVAAEASARDAAIAAAIAALINSAPGALDTLEELADALGDDANFAATMTAALAGKQPLDSDLTAIAALAGQTAFGRSLLALTDAAAMRAALAGIVNADVAAGAALAISKLADPTTGKVIGSTGSVAAAVFPPGYEFDYVARATDGTSTATSAATATTMITANSVTYDGSTTIFIEFYCSRLSASDAGGTVVINIWEGSTDLGYVCLESGGSSSGNGPNTSAFGRLRRTPTSGAKVYTARMWTSAGTANFTAAPTSVPAYLRQVKV